MVESVEASSKKPKVLIIAKTNKDANNQIGKFEKQGFNAKATFIGATKVTNRFQAAIIVVDEGDDYDLFADSLNRFHTVPIVAFLGEVEVGPEFKDSKVFAAEDYAGASEYMKTRIAEVQGDINKVFTQFDEDKSGFIDRGELKTVAAQLGLDLNAGEVSNMIADIDLNGDGKISPEEFQLWWLSGRQGATGSMSQLLSAKLSVSDDTMDSMSKGLKDLAAQAKQGVFKHKSHVIEFNFNGAQAAEAETGVRINASVSAFGEANKNAVMGLKARVCGQEKPFDGDRIQPKIYFSANIKIKEDFEDTHKICEALNDFAKLMLPKDEQKSFNCAFSFVDGRIFLRGSGTQYNQPQTVRLFLDLFDIFSNQTTDQNVTLSAVTGFNFAELFSEDAEAIPSYLMKGFSTKIELNLWDGFHKTMINFAKKMLAGGDEMNEAEQEKMKKSVKLAQKIAPILPLFIAKVNGKFDIDIDPEDVATVMELPQAAMANMNVHTLISSMSPWGTLDDCELIQNDDEDADVEPIWTGFADRDEWTEKDAVDNFFKRLHKLLTCLKSNEEPEEEDLNGFQRDGFQNKLMHVLSMIVDDSIEVEVGVEIDPQEEEKAKGLTHSGYTYKKASIQGAGLGELFKIAMIAKNASQ